MKRILLSAALLLMFIAVSGADETIPSRTSLAFFPHPLHQKVLGGCKECHYDSEPGRIDGFGEKWAHNTCIGCHRDSQRGPVECFRCHTSS